MLAAQHPPAVQAHFCLSDARFRPVVNLNGAMAMLDLSELEIDDLLSEGLLVGFNVAVKKFALRELRFLCKSIEHFKNTGGDRPLDMPWPKVLALMLPHTKPALSSQEIRRSLNCSPELVIDLIEAGELKLMPGTTFRRGRNGNAIVTAQSYAEFLGGRLLE